MPGKFEIMRAVREGLDNLEIDDPKGDTEWTKAVKTKLCEIGLIFGCKVGAGGVDNPGYGEWLYDVTWLEYERDYDGLKWPATALIEAHLVAECEWHRDKNFEEIVYDFEKLLLARAGVRLMIFNGFHEAGSKEIAERLARKVREFEGSRAEDAWLLAAWEGTLDDWSFRYFAITPTTGTLRAFDTSGNPSPLP